MKKIRILSLIIAVVMLLSLTSCTRKMTMNTSGITDKKSGITYNFVTVPLIPKEKSTEAYAVWKMSKDVKINLYEINGLDPEKWLYSEVGDLLCSEKIDFPDLFAFSADKFFICYNSDITISFAEITDEAEVSALVDCYVNGEGVSEPMVGGYNTYVVLFESGAYDEFYYKLMIRVYEDATYMFDRSTGIYVNIGSLLSDYLPDYYESEE